MMPPPMITTSAWGGRASSVATGSTRGAIHLPLSAVRNSVLQQVCDRIPVAAHRRDVVGEGAALDAAQVAALIVVCERQVGDAAGFPELHVAAPFGFLAGGRDAGVDADRRRVTAGLLGNAAQPVESGASLLARAIGQRHPAVAPFDDASQRHLG